ncbi:MAG: hypothetical protein KKB51_09290 [Candidatus Riflebacteria bacterium]|nr:hypothetical protein [Candidatus Riflebacteria bacterium]
MKATTKKVIEAYIQETMATCGMCLISETTFQKEFCGVSELMNKSCNKSVDAENEAGSRALQTQVPRPSLISGHDRRSGKIKDKKLKNLIQSDKNTGQ